MHPQDTWCGWGDGKIQASSCVLSFSSQQTFPQALVIMDIDFCTGALSQWLLWKALYNWNSMTISLFRAVTKAWKGLKIERNIEGTSGRLLYAEVWCLTGNGERSWKLWLMTIFRWRPFFSDVMLFEILKIVNKAFVRMARWLMGLKVTSRKGIEKKVIEC